MNKKDKRYDRKMKFYKYLAKALGLKVGDKIKYGEANFILNQNYVLHNEEKGYDVSMLDLIDDDFEILPPKKKVGELKCCDFTCDNCPLRIIDCSSVASKKIYDILEDFNKAYNDQEIYDIIKKRLDKEVEE